MSRWFFACSVLAVTGTGAACDPCDGPDRIEGSFHLRDQRDVDDFPSGRCVVGQILVGVFDDGAPASAAITSLDGLGELEIIEGTFHLNGNSALTRIALPNLQWIGRRLLAPNADSKQVRGGFFIHNHENLSDLDLPELTDVGGCIEVENNLSLDPRIVDELFRRVRAHALPGPCDGAIKTNENNGGGAR
jgi:hypothetical protein